MITSAPGTEEPQSEEQLKKEHVLMAPAIWRERKCLTMTHKAVLLSQHYNFTDAILSFLQVMKHYWNIKKSP